MRGISFFIFWFFLEVNLLILIPVLRFNYLSLPNHRILVVKYFLNQFIGSIFLLIRLIFSLRFSNENSLLLFFLRVAIIWKLKAVFRIFIVPLRGLVKFRGGGPYLMYIWTPAFIVAHSIALHHEGLHEVLTFKLLLINFFIRNMGDLTQSQQSFIILLCLTILRARSHELAVNYGHLTDWVRVVLESSADDIEIELAEYEFGLEPGLTEEAILWNSYLSNELIQRNNLSTHNTVDVYFF